MCATLTRRHHFNSSGLIALCGLIALASAMQANAACMDSLLHQNSPTRSLGPLRMFPAVYRPLGAATGDLVRVNDDGDADGSIVGLWQFQLTGFSVDYGTQAWHADGTELMFSGGQNPETGDICQGVWRYVGRSTYTLNHIAMGWMAPGGPFGLRVHFHMIVTLDRSGNSFSGSYKAAVYAVSPTDPFDESVQLASGTGKVTATRVQPD